MSDLILNIPSNVENLVLPSPELLTYYKELNERVFWLDDEINSYSLEISRQILIWNREDKDLPIEERKPIRLLFFSPGGDLDMSNSLIDTIKMSLTPVWGINVGMCASGAAFAFLACHKRLMTSRAYFLFHQGSGRFEGTFQEVCAQLEDYQNQVEELMTFMKEHTKYTADEIEEKIVGEWYVHADEALEKGVCDEIIKDVSKLM